MNIFAIIAMMLIVLIFFVTNAWPCIAVVAPGCGAGLLGMIMTPFIAFIFWYAFADIFGKTHGEDIDVSSYRRWGAFFSLIGFVGGVAAYSVSEGDFFAKYIPILAILSILISLLPVITDIFVTKISKVGPPQINASAVVEKVRLQMVYQQELSVDIECGEYLVYDEKTGEFREVN